MTLRRNDSRSGWRKPLLGLSFMVALSGCAFAPGGHIDYDTQGEDLSENIEVKPITPSLVKTMAASGNELRESLFEYAENAEPQMEDTDYPASFTRVLIERSEGTDWWHRLSGSASSVRMAVE